jgi:hypothetical protein
MMFDRFGYPGLFAAYNAGPARYQRHLDTGEALPGETVAYIAKLANSPVDAAHPRATLVGPQLFVVLGLAPKTSTSLPSRGGLFVPLSANTAAVPIAQE